MRAIAEVISHLRSVIVLLGIGGQAYFAWSSGESSRGGYPHLRLQQLTVDIVAILLLLFSIVEVCTESYSVIGFAWIDRVTALQTFCPLVCGTTIKFQFHSIVAQWFLGFQRTGWRDVSCTKPQRNRDIVSKIRQ